MNDTTQMHITHGDGYTAEYTMAEGSVAVLLTAPGGRSWRAERPTFDEAVEVAGRMYRERATADVADKLAASWMFAAEFEAKDAEIARLQCKIAALETEHGKRP